jgi:hypothetical protein
VSTALEASSGRIVEWMISRREAALRLDIPLEMARKHGLATRISEAELSELDRNPPAWLAQSRANRRGVRAIVGGASLGE